MLDPRAGRRRAFRRECCRNATPRPRDPKHRTGCTRGVQIFRHLASPIPYNVLHMAYAFLSVERSS
jgi:hypothetical protein